MTNPEHTLQSYGRPEQIEAPRVRNEQQLGQLAMHDIELAHDEALKDNEIFDAHTEALAENEIFDAHTEALKMNDEHDDAKKKAEKSEPVPARPQAVRENIVSPVTPDTDVVTYATAYRNQAAQALRRTGLDNTGLQKDDYVERDFVTGEYVVAGATGNELRIIEPMPGGNRIRDYKFDEENGVLSIKTEGGSAVLTQVGDYVSADAASSSVKLPPAVARMVGFERATLV